jgi:hypothetical protein
MRELAIAITDFEAEAEAAEVLYTAERRALEHMPGTRFLFSEMDDLLDSIRDSHGTI